MILLSRSLILHKLLSCTLESYIMQMRLVGPEILIYLLYKHNASHLLFSLYQSNASHFLFSLDHCNARLLLFSLVQDRVMATTSCFHYSRTVWCQLPLILLCRRAFEQSILFSREYTQKCQGPQGSKAPKKMVGNTPPDNFVAGRMAGFMQCVQRRGQRWEFKNYCGTGLNSRNCLSVQ